MTGLSTTTSLSDFFDVKWERDVVKVPATCPKCGREAVQLFIEKWGISPIACDWCADEWERQEGMHSDNERARAFAACGIPEWAAVLEPDGDGLAEFLHDLGAKGIRAKWLQRDDPDAATRDACRLLRAWMGSKGEAEHEAYRTGAYVMETAIYAKDGIGNAANAGLLVIDGFGRRAPTRYEAGRLRELLEHRRINRLPVVVATTLNIGKAGDVVGKVSGEGTAAMEAIVAMMRGAR